MRHHRPRPIRRCLVCLVRTPDGPYCPRCAAAWAALLAWPVPGVGR